MYLKSSGLNAPTLAKFSLEMCFLRISINVGELWASEKTIKSVQILLFFSFLENKVSKKTKKLGDYGEIISICCMLILRFVKFVEVSRLLGNTKDILKSFKSKHLNQSLVVVGLILKWLETLYEFFTLCVGECRANDKRFHSTHKKDIRGDDSNSRRWNMQHLRVIQENRHIIVFWANKIAHNSLNSISRSCEDNIPWRDPFLEFFTLQKLLDCEFFVFFFVKCQRVRWNKLYSNLKCLFH